MFCPGCGLEERSTNQFCRVCGANLTIVRAALESPDSITASAISARNEISRAFAERIRNAQADELVKFSEEGLPQLEKFFESPEERSLRWLRTGSTVSFIGLGATIAFALAGIFMKSDMFFMAAAGLVTFFIGLSLVVSGKYFVIPRKTLTNTMSDRQYELDKAITNELIPPKPSNLFSSVTETTTRNLQEK